MAARLRGEVKVLQSVAGRPADVASARAALLLQGEAHCALGRWGVYSRYNFELFQRPAGWVAMQPAHGRRCCWQGETHQQLSGRGVDWISNVPSIEVGCSVDVHQRQRQIRPAHGRRCCCRAKLTASSAGGASSCLISSLIERKRLKLKSVK